MKKPLPVAGTILFLIAGMSCTTESNAPVSTEMAATKWSGSFILRLAAIIIFMIQFASLDQVQAADYAIGADREWAYDRNSSVGHLDQGLDEAHTKGWTVVDMKEDWKSIFPSKSR